MQLRNNSVLLLNLLIVYNSQYFKLLKKQIINSIFDMHKSWKSFAQLNMIVYFPPQVKPFGQYLFHVKKITFIEIITRKKCYTILFNKKSIHKDIKTLFVNQFVIKVHFCLFDIIFEEWKKKAFLKCPFCKENRYKKRKLDLTQWLQFENRDILWMVQYLYFSNYIECFAKVLVQFFPLIQRKKSLLYKSYYRMKEKKLLMTPALILLFVQMSLCSINTYNFTFSNYYNTGLGFLDSKDIFSIWELGTLNAGDNITFNFTLPYVGANETSLAFNYLPYFTSLYFLNETNPLNSTYTPATNANGTAYTFPLFTNLSGHYTTYQTTYQVSFNDPNLNSAKFRLLIFDIYSINLPYLDFISLKITKNSVPLILATDLLRYFIVKVIYIDTPGNNTYIFTTYPAVSWTSSTPGLSQFAYTKLLINQTGPNLNGNNWPTSGFRSIVSQQYAAANQTFPNFTNNIAHWNVTLDPGYYAILFASATNQTNSTGWIQYPSAQYRCPYDPDYQDVFRNFQPCIPVPFKQNPGLPCTAYDPIQGLCTACISGYYLQFGQCMANTTCPPRQFFHFGVCSPVNPLCDAFDAFTGDCLNCSNPQNYNLINGSCLEIVVVCQSRQWQQNHTCFNVSSTCNAFDPSNGRCLSCLKEGDQVKADGSCAPIIVICPTGMYAVKLVCTKIPNECNDFNTSLGVCLSCIRGYTVKNGVCERIQCPSRKVPSIDGLSCVSVSDLCDSYDPISGGCLSCRDAGTTVSGGQCLQVTSPLAGCMQRQQLGFGPCVGADVNCEVFNLISGNCQQCKSSFSFDYTGHCVASAVCGYQQWSVNGECLQYPDNCVKVDSLGLCTQCVNADYRLMMGQCVFFKKCTERQYLNSAGQCLDVSADCGTFNPSNGDCITCRVATVTPVKGICCADGQIYNRSAGRCVDASTTGPSNVGNGPTCLSAHPSLNYCLACSPGSSPDYSIPYRCA